MKNLPKKRQNLFFSQINQKVHKRHSKKKSSRALAIIPYSRRQLGQETKTDLKLTKEQWTA